MASGFTRAWETVFQYFKKVDKNSTSEVPGLTEEELEWAKEEVKQVIDKNSKKDPHNNLFMPQQRANIGKYSVEQGPTSASCHFTDYTWWG